MTPDKAARIAANSEALYEALDALTKALVWQCPAVDNYLTISSSRLAFQARLLEVIEHARAVLRRIEDER